VSFKVHGGGCEYGSFWDLVLCSLVEVDRRFCCIIALMMEAVRPTEKSVNFNETTRAISQKAVIFIFMGITADSANPSHMYLLQYKIILTDGTGLDLYRLRPCDIRFWRFYLTPRSPPYVRRLHLSTSVIHPVFLCEKWRNKESTEGRKMKGGKDRQRERIETDEKTGEQKGGNEKDT
jgi:hypothetical protein